MSAPTTSHCPLGITPDDLSAWRDHALPSDEEQRITTHIATCPACQRIIAADDALAATLVADQPPAPDAQNWQRLQARIAANTPSTAAQRHAPRRALWSGLAAAAAVLLISALFMQLFGQLALRRGANSHHKTTIASTPPALASVPPTTPIAGPRLNWQYHSAPESVIPPPGNQTYDNGFGFSPTDARTAYICATTNAIGAPNTIWATHDGAATWTHVGDIPYSGDVAQCSVTVDAANPLHVHAILSQQNLKGQSVATSAISDDGGKTWRILSDDVQLVGLVTHGDVSVALVYPWDGIVYSSAHPRPPHISVSRDDWRTWQPIDGPLLAQAAQSGKAYVTRVWQRPGDGALLAEISVKNPAFNIATPNTMILAYTVQLWTSADLGAHWQLLPMPPNLNPLDNALVAQPRGTDAWKVCGLVNLPNSDPSKVSQRIGCTLDGGQTWSARPLPALYQRCDNGANPKCLQQQTIGMFGGSLLSDGSLLATFYAGSNDPGVVETYSMYHPFLLAPGATHWQDLGSIPSSEMLALATQPNGTLVSYSGGGSTDGVSGEIVGHLGGDVPNRGVFAIATLP